MSDRITCTCVDVPASVAELCPYCRAEAIRLERMYREVESFAAMKATVGLKVKVVGFRRVPYRTRLMRYGQVIKKLEAA